jgi:hypothetical protein
MTPSAKKNNIIDQISYNINMVQHEYMHWVANHNRSKVEAISGTKAQQHTNQHDHHQLSNPIRRRGKRGRVISPWALGSLTRRRSRSRSRGSRSASKGSRSPSRGSRSTSTRRRRGRRRRGGGISRHRVTAAAGAATWRRTPKVRNGGEVL